MAHELWELQQKQSLPLPAKKNNVFEQNPGLV